MKLTHDPENIHFSFSPKNRPVLEIESRQTLTVETLDASNGQIRPGNQTPINRSRLLPITGPIQIKGARPGHALAVKIQAIDFPEYGYAWIREGLGIHTVSVDGPYHAQRFRITDRVEIPGGALIPMRPMVGIVGVATETEISPRLPGRHGGNLDCPDVCPGNTLWLPVIIPGAGLSLGDVHAAMGDGEVSGTGVEIEATVTIGVDLHEDLSISGPIVTTPEKTVFLASEVTAEKAARVALGRAIRALTGRMALSEKDACITAGVSGNLRFCQMVNGDITVGYELPREVFQW